MNKFRFQFEKSLNIAPCLIATAPSWVDTALQGVQAKVDPYGINNVVLAFEILVEIISYRVDTGLQGVQAKVDPYEIIIIVFASEGWIDKATKGGTGEG